MKPGPGDKETKMVCKGHHRGGRKRIQSKFCFNITHGMWCSIQNSGLWGQPCGWNLSERKWIASTPSKNASDFLFIVIIICGLGLGVVENGNQHPLQGPPAPRAQLLTPTLNTSSSESALVWGSRVTHGSPSSLQGLRAPGRAREGTAGLSLGHHSECPRWHVGESL